MKRRYVASAGRIAGRLKRYDPLSRRHAEARQRSDGLRCSGGAHGTRPL